MARDIFVDTSGFYALLVKLDDQHKRATPILRDARDSAQRFVTTDYVLDETPVFARHVSSGIIVGVPPRADIWSAFPNAHRVTQGDPICPFRQGNDRVDVS